MNDAGRKVKCVKLGKELPGLEKPPFSGELGRLIYENVSREAWEMWNDMQIKILNEYRLNMGNKRDYEVLLEQMQLFLNLKAGESVEVNDEKRGRGEKE